MKNRELSTTSSGQGEFLDIIPRRRLLPGEDQIAYDGLRAALLGDLKPGTPYEMAVAENMVELEWDGHRYRKIRDDLIRERFRQEAADAFVVYNPFPVGSFGDDDRQEAKRQAGHLLGPAGPEQDSAIAELAEKGSDLNTLVAKAYGRGLKTLDTLERHIAELEARRRRLRSDFDALKRQRSQHVPDAEVIEGDDD